MDFAFAPRPAQFIKDFRDGLVLTVAPGSWLQRCNASAQNMVIAGVRGQAVDANRFVARSEISASATPRTYVLDAYCTDFQKVNPSTGT